MQRQQSDSQECKGNKAIIQSAKTIQHQDCKDNTTRIENAKTSRTCKDNTAISESANTIRCGGLGGPRATAGILLPSQSGTHLRGYPLAPRCGDSTQHRGLCRPPRRMSWEVRNLSRALPWILQGTKLALLHLHMQSWCWKSKVISGTHYPDVLLIVVFARPLLNTQLQFSSGRRAESFRGPTSGLEEPSHFLGSLHTDSSLPVRGWVGKVLWPFT